MNEPRPRSTATTPSDAPDDALARLRSEIDRIDGEILAALNRRAERVQRVGELKRASRSSVYIAARERDLVAALSGNNEGPFPSEGIGPVFREIISATRSLEERLRVAFLGPEGTFSHLAARETFGGQVDLVPMGSIQEVLAALERGDADHALLPVENTTEGVVTQTLDALLESDLVICGETLLPISNNLMSSSGDLARVRRVASHPQPLAQCRTWLDRNLPGVERVERSSTAAAAQMAREEDDVAAVGSSLCGELQGLRIIAPAIEDRRDNTTRFLVLGGDAPPPSKSDHTLLAFTVRKSESGALFRLLEPFSGGGVNLTSIQARPLKGRPWEYVFFLEAEGHQADAQVARAIEEAAQRANSHRVLGSFPHAALPSREAVS